MTATKLTSLGVHEKLFNHPTFERIEEEDVQRLLASLDVSKTPGLDGISSRVLKMVAPAITSSLTLQFTFSLLCGQVATEWKFARVALVPTNISS